MASNVWPDPAERIAELEAMLAERDATITEMVDVVEAAKNHAALWQAQKISGASRSERNAAIEAARGELIRAIDALKDKAG